MISNGYHVHTIRLIFDEDEKKQTNINIFGIGQQKQNHNKMPNELGLNCAAVHRNFVFGLFFLLSRYFHLYLVIRLHVRHQNFNQSAEPRLNDL